MTTPWVAGPEPDRVVSYGTNSDQLIEFFGDTGPLVAVIHGGYWRAKHNREHMRALSARIVENGFQVANIEYRRDPKNPNQTFKDVTKALATLEPLNAIVGFSVGGQLALLNSEFVHKLILLAPVTDLERTKRESLGEGAVAEFFGDLDLHVFDPMKREYNSHLYIIHGDHDSRVPISHSRDFAKSKVASLIELSGADHFDVIDPNGIAAELIIKTLSN